MQGGPSEVINEDDISNEDDSSFEEEEDEDNDEEEIVAEEDELAPIDQDAELLSHILEAGGYQVILCWLLSI